MKLCSDCGYENPNKAYWCQKCNAKLVNPPSNDKKITNDEEKIERDNLEYEYLNDDLSKKIRKIYVIFVVLIIIISAGIVTYFTIYKGPDFEGINSAINEDFWFEGNNLITSQGWNFTMTKVKDYNLEGIVLGLHYYYEDDIPYRPINIFSPIDLYIGVEDVKDNPEKYPHRITSYSDRVGWTEYDMDDIDDQNYFRSHTCNNHIIPHNKDVLNELKNVSVMDIVNIEGSLVDLYGTKGEQYYYWNTDTVIGNFNCEIILVDSITII